MTTRSYDDKSSLLRAICNSKPFAGLIVKDLRQCKIVFKGDVFHAITVVFSMKSQSNLKGNPLNLCRVSSVARTWKLKSSVNVATSFEIREARQSPLNNWSACVQSRCSGGPPVGLKADETCMLYAMQKGSFLTRSLTYQPHRPHFYHHIGRTVACQNHKQLGVQRGGHRKILFITHQEI